MDTNENIAEEKEELNTAPETEAAKEAPEEAPAEKDSGHKESKKSKKNSDADIKNLKAELEELKKQISTLSEQKAEAEDKYLRCAAEYDNFRRRSQKEREGIYADAAADSIKNLLPLLDNLKRATEYTAADKVAEGLQMILGSLPDVLEKMGITTFGQVGEQFDPNIHNAVMHEENPEKGENEIIAVFQEGYRMGDKIIRYAMVTVAN